MRGDIRRLNITGWEDKSGTDQKKDPDQVYTSHSGRIKSNTNTVIIQGNSIHSTMQDNKMNGFRPAATAPKQLIKLVKIT